METQRHDERCRFSGGQVIFHEGEPAHCAYVINYGRVEIAAESGGERRVLVTLGPGEMFGEMAALDGTVRSASALALEETELTVIEDDQLRGRVEAAEPVLGMLLKVILDRFRREQSLFRGNQIAEPQQLSLPRVSDLGARSAIDKIRLESELRGALERKELVLHYQPIVSLPTGSVSGFEALARWQHPELGLLFPDRFIGLAEETALIVPMGLWVLEQACQDLRLFQAALDESGDSHRSLTMSVNVSGRQFAESQFLDDLEQVLARTGVTPDRIKLEITERVLMDYELAPLAWIERCKALGTTVALDDFGTGFSSLSYLASFPIDTLKIDKSFVLGMHKDPRSLKIVRAINQLAHGIGLDVIAEGVEETVHRDELVAMDCEYAQGYLFSRPVSLDQALRQLRAEAAEATA